jgi:hypothetical protein
MNRPITTMIGTKVSCSEWREHKILLQIQIGDSKRIAHLTKLQAKVLIDELNNLIQKDY